MPPSARNGHHILALEAGDHAGDRVVHHVAAPHLAVGAKSPGVHLSLGGHARAVRVASRDCFDIAPPKCSDCRRLAHVSFRVVSLARLPVVAHPARKHISALCQNKGKAAASFGLQNLLAEINLHRDVLRVFVACAKRSFVALSPREQAAIIGDSQCVVAPTRHRHDAGAVQAFHLLRKESGACMAQCALAPRVQLPFPIDCNSV
mmetsp:Transcript_1764/g.1942  ORF Transcript_1764/g.1942 Transcript_1764/m.1942 type:complete len:205 (+) Transcript_1764:153-767(+)